MDARFADIAVTTALPPDVRRRLHVDGFAVIEHAFDAAVLREPYDEAVRTADPADVGRSTSTRVHGLVDGGPAFDSLYVHPSVLAASSTVIGQPFRLSCLLARTVEPGVPAQELHVDCARDDAGYPMLGFIVMVDAFTADNGVT